MVNLIKIAAEQANIDIKLDKITDISEIMPYRVMSTPGVVINDKVVHAGDLADPDTIRQWLKD